MGFICIFFIVLIAFVVILAIVQCILKKGAALKLIFLNAAFIMVMFILFSLILVICSCITSNTKYIVEDKKYEIEDEEMDKNKICLDGEKYKYSFEYDSNAASSYAKKIKYQYTKAEKFWFGNLLENYAAIIYTNDRLLIQSHDSK